MPHVTVTWKTAPRHTVRRGTMTENTGTGEHGGHGAGHERGGRTGRCGPRGSGTGAVPRTGQAPVFSGAPASPASWASPVPCTRTGDTRFSAQYRRKALTRPTTQP